MKTVNKLTDTQAILAYVAHIIGNYEAFKKAASFHSDYNRMQKLCKIARFVDEYGKQNENQFLGLGEAADPADVAFVRNALKGDYKFGDYTNGLIVGIFGYNADI